MCAKLQVYLSSFSSASPKPVSHFKTVDCHLKNLIISNQYSVSDGIIFDAA